MIVVKLWLCWYVMVFVEVLCVGWWCVMLCEIVVVGECVG